MFSGLDKTIELKMNVLVNYIGGFYFAEFAPVMDGCLGRSTLLTDEGKYTPILV